MYPEEKHDQTKKKMMFIYGKKRLTENWPDKFRQVLLNMQNGVCWPLLLCWKLFVRHDIQRIKVVIDPPLNIVCLFVCFNLGLHLIYDTSDQTMALVLLLKSSFLILIRITFYFAVASLLGHYNCTFLWVQL